jgi:antitoxin component of MazEF toxin-antitoxin module
VKTKIVSIGNSRGIRIPKIAFEESGLERKLELKVKKGEIRIIATKKRKIQHEG